MLSESPYPRETDVLVATGEQVSAALLDTNNSQRLVKATGV
jgi:aspartokinase